MHFPDRLYRADALLPLWRLGDCPGAILWTASRVLVVECRRG